MAENLLKMAALLYLNVLEADVFLVALLAECTVLVFAVLLLLVVRDTLDRFIKLPTLPEHL